MITHVPKLTRDYSVWDGPDPPSNTVFGMCDQVSNLIKNKKLSFLVFPHYCKKGTRNGKKLAFHTPREKWKF